jgi:hypothetical protein
VWLEFCGSEVLQLMQLMQDGPKRLQANTQDLQSALRPYKAHSVGMACTQQHFRHKLSWFSWFSMNIMVMNLTRRCQ